VVVVVAEEEAIRRPLRLDLNSNHNNTKRREEELEASLLVEWVFLASSRIYSPRMKMEQEVEVVEEEVEE